MDENEHEHVPKLADHVKFKVTPDKLTAFVSLAPPPSLESGFTASASELVDLLEEQGIVSGLIPTEEIQNLLDGWVEPVPQILVAQGTPPTAPVAEDLVFHFERDPVIHLEEREDGSVDYRELGILQNALAGQLLVEKTPAIPGEPGVDVYGLPVAPKPPVTIRIPAGKGTEVSEDGFALFAAHDGLILYGPDKKVVVSPVYYVQGCVDFSTGNIDFRGSVVVRENIQSGFTVVADDNVEVFGIVEKATVACGGDIVVRGGVQGSAKTSLEAAGNVRALYLQNAVVKAGHEVIVADSVMHSHVVARSVRVTGKRALLVGGVCAATDLVSVRVAGSHMSTPTRIVLGYFPSPRERLLEIEAEMQSVEESIGKVRDALFRLASAQGRALGSGAVAMQERVQETLAAEERRLAELLEEHARWQERLQGPEPFVKITTVAYPGVRIESSVVMHTVSELTHACRFVLHETEIERISG
ncbi:MAG: FapA family protein [Firmicutes bacterium]|nr:FapA family protein [Bacillota bacterium]